MDENPNNNNNIESKLMYQKRKLAEQDDLIDNMIALNKENKELGKEMNSHLSAQLVQMEKLNTDMDIVGNKMDKTNNRFIAYLDSSSHCRLWIIIIAQLFLIVYLLLTL